MTPDSSTPKKTHNFQRYDPRSVEIVTAEYNRHATLAGHKARLVQELREDIPKLEQEIQEHLKVMRAAAFSAAQKSELDHSANAAPVMASILENSCGQKKRP